MEVGCNVLQGLLRWVHSVAKSYFTIDLKWVIIKVIKMHLKIIDSFKEWITQYLSKQNKFNKNILNDAQKNKYYHIIKI